MSWPADCSCLAKSSWWPASMCRPNSCRPKPSSCRGAPNASSSGGGGANGSVVGRTGANGSDAARANGSAGRENGSVEGRAKGSVVGRCGPKASADQPCSTCCGGGGDWRPSGGRSAAGTHSGAKDIEAAPRLDMDGVRMNEDRCGESSRVERASASSDCRDISMAKRKESSTRGADQRGGGGGGGGASFGGRKPSAKAPGGGDELRASGPLKCSAGPGDRTPGAAP
mmetsp:Transcript_12854/g.42926  ORF Transcript_12854/g.42926 Transcript_12854/m.42926 type:complete len:227 (+) Transcript_12854:148-828(+)